MFSVKVVRKRAFVSHLMYLLYFEQGNGRIRWAGPRITWLDPDKCMSPLFQDRSLALCVVCKRLISGFGRANRAACPELLQTLLGSVLSCFDSGENFPCYLFAVYIFVSSVLAIF